MLKIRAFLEQRKEDDLTLRYFSTNQINYHVKVFAGRSNERD
jgi:hypothetical protein